MSEFYIPGLDLIKLDVDRFERRITVHGNIYFRRNEIAEYIGIPTTGLAQWIMISDLRPFIAKNSRYGINVSALMLLAEPHRTIRSLIIKKNMWLILHYWPLGGNRNIVSFRKAFCAKDSSEYPIGEKFTKKVTCANAKLVACILTVLWRSMWRPGRVGNFLMTNDQCDATKDLISGIRNLFESDTPEKTIEILIQESFVRGLF